MGFVDHADDAVGIVDHIHCGEFRHRFVFAQGTGQIFGQILLVLLKLVDHHHVQVGRGRGQFGFQVFAAVDERDLFAR